MELEEIFWKDGKFVNSKGEEVNPIPIGEPKIIEMRALSYNNPYGILIESEKYDKKYKEVNAYIKGISQRGLGGDFSVPLTIFSFYFFKI